MSLPVHLVGSLTGVTVGSTVDVTGDEAHHAVAVRRMRVGERLVLTDGVGTRIVGSVADTGKRLLRVRVDEVERNPVPSPEIVVVQALPKGDRGELAVEVLTEIGVAEIVPWTAARSIAVWKGERGDKALARWRTTAREAAKQARRSWHPEVAPLASTADVVTLIEEADLAVILHEAAAGSFSDVIVPDRGRILVVVGPEGGLTDVELAAFTDAGASSLRLGGEILRTSTAGLAAVAAVLSRTPRWS